MGKALELITGYVTAPSTTFTGLTMASGNSLTVRSAKEGSAIHLLNAWADVQGAGNLRIRSPRLHDNVQGIRLTTLVANLKCLLPLDTKEPLIGQDTLTVELTGSATGGDIETACMLVYYDDLPGVEARLIGIDEYLSRRKHMVTIENTIATGTGGGYSGEEALNAEFNLLKANTDYAWLGSQVSAQCACVRMRGSDFGNLGIGMPGGVGEHWLFQNWFYNLSERTRMPLIPVFNSANISGMLVDAAQDENGTDVTVTWILAELATG